MIKPHLLIVLGAFFAPFAVAQTPPDSTTPPSPGIRPSPSASATPGSSSSASARKTANAADKTFIAGAVQGDMAEVKMGQLAQQKGQSAAVKDFGKMLEHDHGEHLMKAQDMAKMAGVTPPSAVTAAQKAAYAKVMKSDGAAFDAAFKTAMIKDHNEDIAKYQKQANSGGAFADFAQETLPTLQMHLKTAQALDTK